jgi:thioredoxin reductase (NADPH)
VTNKLSGEVRKIPASAMFVAIGQMPVNISFKNVADLDRSGYIESGEDCRTKTPGIFTAGDCRTKQVRQLATAAADGAVAGLAAVEYIR